MFPELVFAIINTNNSSGVVVVAKQNSINLMQFQTIFSSEEACHNHLYQMKWSDGFKCPRCGHSQAYKIKTRKSPLYECVDCKHQTTVTAGTIFEKTRTDLRIWFLAIFLVAHDKRGNSATFLSNQLGICYQTAWTMLHKIRKAMGERDTNYTLAGIVELDDAYFGSPTKGGKRGRGTEQTQVLVGLSLNSIGQPLYIKMEIIPDLRGTTISDFAQRTIEEGSVISSDKYRSYNVLTADPKYEHKPKIFNPKEDSEHLKWLHTIISNAKAFVAGTYHGLGTKHLQAYLNEFCYRFNRRMFKGELFNRLVKACVSVSTITYPELVG